MCKEKNTPAVAGKEVLGTGPAEAVVWVGKTMKGATSWMAT